VTSQDGAALSLGDCTPASLCVVSALLPSGTEIGDGTAEPALVGWCPAPSLRGVGISVGITLPGSYRGPPGDCSIGYQATYFVTGLARAVVCRTALPDNQDH